MLFFVVWVAANAIDAIDSHFNHYFNHYARRTNAMEYVKYNVDELTLCWFFIELVQVIREKKTEKNSSWEQFVGNE